MDPNPPKFWGILLDTIGVSVQILDHVLSSKEGREFVCALGPRDAGLCIELLDRGVGNHSFDRGTFLLTLISLANRHKRFPCSVAITNGVHVSGRAIASGGFADVRHATYGSRTVIVRTLRVTPSDERERIWNRFCKEVIIWNSLSHRNILKFLGVLGGIHSPSFSTVADFMANGNIMQYIENNYSNRLELLHGVAEGLKYVHDMNLAYGDLKGANVLITSEVPPHACLADFGFTTVVPESCKPFPFPTVVEGGTFSFMAPELLAPVRFGLRGSTPTKEADMFAFGLVVIQVLTGEQPFSYPTKSAHIHAIAGGARPKRPANGESIGLSNPLWELVKACWDEDRTKRPRIQEVAARVGDAAASWCTLMPPSGLTHDGGSAPRRSKWVDDSDGSLGQHPSEGSEFYSPIGTHSPTPELDVQGPSFTQSQSMHNLPTGDYRETTGMDILPHDTTLPPHGTLCPVDPSVLWREVVTSPSDGARPVQALAEILANKQGRSFVFQLERNDADLCLEVLDRGLAEHKLTRTEKQIFFITLRRLAGMHGHLPTSMMITDRVDISNQIRMSGGSADIRVGIHRKILVAVKSLRVLPTDDLTKIRKQFCKEVILWKSLSHPNILKLVGVLKGVDQCDFSTISEWMEHGDIMEYIKDCRHSVNRLGLLHGAAKGLKYLHDANLVHGDLKGTNIFITNEIPPQACLADFGFMTMAFDHQNPMSCSADLEGGTTWFMAPELLEPLDFASNSSVPTHESDIYAFGMVIFQVLTGEMPFRHLRACEVELAIVGGTRPEKPKDALTIGFSDSLWKFVQLCWDSDRRRRPKARDVVTRVGDAAADWNVSECYHSPNLSQAPNSPLPLLHWGASRIHRSPTNSTTVQQKLRGISLPIPPPSSPENASPAMHQPRSNILENFDKRYSLPFSRTFPGSAAAQG